MTKPPAFRAITLAGESDLPRIFEVWESSVRATHAFLTEDDRQFLIPLVKAGLAEFGPLQCLRDPEGRVFAFMGVEGVKIEMLFVHADHRGRGAGGPAHRIRDPGARGHPGRCERAERPGAGVLPPSWLPAHRQVALGPVRQAVSHPPPGAAPRIGDRPLWQIAPRRSGPWPFARWSAGAWRPGAGPAPPGRPFWAFDPPA